MAKLVVGCDGSEGGEAALGEAIRLASDLGDELVLVFGYDPPHYDTEELAAHRAEVRKLGEHVTATALERARREGVTAEVSLIPARPPQALLQAAGEHDARAIVVGSYSEHPIRGAILGATPHKLVHLSDRPVLVVPIA